MLLNVEPPKNSVILLFVAAPSYLSHIDLGIELRHIRNSLKTLSFDLHAVTGIDNQCDHP